MLPQVIIADDHFLVAHGLKELLSKDYEVLEIVSDGEQLVEAALNKKPDLIVVDISMPNLNGLQAIEKLRQHGCSARIVVLTMHVDPVFAARAISLGASAYVLKNSAVTFLLSAIQHAMSGETFIAEELSPNVSQLLLAGPDEFAVDQRLTPRQLEVLKLFAEGYSAKEVARELSISKRTAENHKASIKRLLGVNSTAELTKLAIRFGLVGAE
ncbi:MAG: response regulator transcription factor [Pirellulaceae bacterium]|jgi:DNA-binding NarL/FixJ family response regulator|nr:response regulator transcription factor [Pirellulaceae bacterium]